MAALDKFFTVYKLETKLDGTNGVIEYPDDLKEMMESGYLMDKKEIVDGDRLIIVLYFDMT